MLDEPAASQWDRNGAGLWHKQALAVVALVVVTAMALWILRAGWNLLVGGPASAQRREVVVWHDPVHRLALEYAGRIESATSTSEAEAGDAPDVDVDFDAQP